MSVGPASAWADQAKATRLPSGDNAGDPSTPGYEANGNSWAGALTGVSARQTSAPAITAATSTRALTAILARLKVGTGGVISIGGVCCTSAVTTGGAVWV